MSTEHLKLRSRTWYARLAVPPKDQGVVGRTELVRSLKTRDLREANRLKYAALAVMQAEISRAVTVAMPSQAGGDVLATAEQLRAAVLKGETTRKDAELSFDATLERHLDAAGAAHGVSPEVGHPALPEGHVGTLRLAHEVFYTGGVTLLSKSIEAYLAETAPRVRVGTITEKRKQLTAFAAWLKPDCAVSSIKKRLAGRYVAEVLLKKGIAAHTVKHIMSDLSAYFGWLVSRGEIDANPWQGMAGAVKTSSRGTAAKRRPWRDEEALQLLKALPDDSMLLPLTAIGLYAGMRIDELCSLKLENVTKDSFTITSSKTQAGVRVVPVHPIIRPLVARLLKTTTDDYLLPGLLAGGADAKRGHYIGKRFGATARRVVISDKALVYHGLRASFAQKLERGGVPVSTAALLLGHERSGMTYGTYSKGVDEGALRAAVVRVSYGAKVDALVRDLGQFTLVARSRGRPKRAG